MPKWTAEQLEAIEKVGTSIIVSAGAGSGKTAVLTERVIHHLQRGVKINELLILTFTNAAAGEMKDRIRKKISEHPELKDNLDYLDSSYITTFDSFTLSLVKKYHYLLNVSPSLSIVDSGIINLLKEQILNEVFDKFYFDTDPKFLKFINDFCIKNDTSLKGSIRKIISSLELKSNLDDYLDSYLEVEFSSSKIASYLEDFVNLIRLEIENIENSIYMLSESDYYDYYEQMQKVLEPLVKARTYDEIKKAINVTMPRRPRGSDDIKEHKEQIDLSLKALKEYLRFSSEEEILESFNIAKDYIEVIIKIIKEFNIRLQNYKLSNDLYEFTDIELMAISLLKDNPKICNELRYFYQEIMVDEYQDTNDLQEEFISLIENNNVYMVGDIKQSIYGFRNANPQIFKNKYDKYSQNTGGYKIDLLKNFRSRDEVLKGINLIFNLIMDDNIGGAAYEEGHQMVFGNMSYEENKEECQNYDLEILNYVQTDENYTKEEIEAFIIGNDIKKKINDGYQVVDKETGKLRNCNFQDFCIIMDRGSSFPIYKNIFEYLQIPLNIWEDKKLTSETDIMLINNILNLILKIYKREFDQEFRYSFVSIARSYLFSYPDEKILTIIRDKIYYNDDIYLIAQEISKHIEVLSSYEVLMRIIDNYHMYEKSITVGNIDNLVIRLDNLLSVANNLSLSGYTLSDFRAYLNVMINSDNEISYKVTSQVNSSVKIMNIHKSKGLEFPICYFSGYHKAFNTSDIKERFVYDNTYGIITPFFKEGIGSLILKDLLKNKYLLENISERIRLFYVAVTRAKEKMIIVTSLDEEEQMPVLKLVDDFKRRKYNSFLSIINTIKGNLKEFTNNVDLNKLNLSKDYLNKTLNIKNNVQDSQTIKHEEIMLPNEEIIQKHASKTINELIGEQTSKILEYGTKMHQVFEMTDFCNLKKDDEHYAILSNFVNKLNINQNTKVYKEHEFIYEEEHVLYHGIIDLVLIDNDVIKIVDYKLKNIDDPKYYDQLRVYYDYLKIHFDKKIEVYLYSIIDNHLKELKLD